jgi:NAD+ synthase (glutamine-hydrolysing)
MVALRIAMAQINTTVGDFAGNTRKILASMDQARDLGVDLLTLPELATCGYPPEDLLFKQQFLQANRQVLEDVVRASSGLTLIVGFVDVNQDNYNAAAVIRDGNIVGVYRKILLPNYGVFDENRYFQPGRECPLFVIGGVAVGVNVCEDIWFEDGPPMTQALAGAEVIVNISASPYHAGKPHFREDMLRSRALDNLAIIAHNNLVGGQDELVFDGNSMILDEKGAVIGKGLHFQEDFIVADLDLESVCQARRRDGRWQQDSEKGDKNWPTPKVLVSESAWAGEKPTIEDREIEVPGFPGEVYDALVLGTKDYVQKNGFNKVLIGVSGGIDSALVAAVAVDALGPNNVVGVTMPSRYSSVGSTSDSESLARNLGMDLLTLPIEKAFQSYLDILSGAFEGTEPNEAEENLQARIRGNLLMGLSNKVGWLVLTTGNKSEMATGYATLYGDMAGGFAVIKDVPKTLVYQLCRYRNELAGKEVIPLSIINKEPSAELRPDQRDVDSLPPYEVLDPILKLYVEEDKSVDEIIALGFDEAAVRRAARLVDMSEYKRRQAPPGVKITPRAFGRDRRLPIANRFRGC